VHPPTQALVNALLSSLKALLNVGLLFLFVFTIWGILAMQLWGTAGYIHGRCRLTAVPVRLPANFSAFPLNETGLASLYADGQAERCLPFENDARAWGDAGKQGCAWPLDPAQSERLCKLASAPGGYACMPQLDESLGRKVSTFCGSNYNTDGSERFENLKLMESDLFAEAFSWGFSDYRNWWYTSLTLFQVMTMEGWALAMYHVQDCWHPAGAAIYFFSLVLVGGFFILNFTLAMLHESFIAASVREPRVTGLSSDSAEPTPRLD
jgi:hypothetical protein